jgi:hypothetical protein
MPATIDSDFGRPKAAMLQTKTVDVHRLLASNIGILNKSIDCGIPAATIRL